MIRAGSELRILMSNVVHQDAKMCSMRTTVTLDDDVEAAVNRIMRERSLRLSQAINELIRAGLSARQNRRSFRQRSRRIGLRIDVTNVADALEVMEGPARR